MIAIVIGALSLALASFQSEEGTRAPVFLGTFAGRLVVDPAGGYWVVPLAGDLYRSADQGLTWQRVEGPLQPPAASKHRPRINGLHFFESDAAVLTGVFPPTRDLFYRTADRGESWASTNHGGFVCYQADACSDGSIWAVGPGNSFAKDRRVMLVSDDGGASWLSVEAGLEHVALRSISFPTPDFGVVGGMQNSLHTTIDGGSSWSAIPTPLDLHPDRVDLVNEGLVILGVARDKQDRNAVTAPVEEVAVWGERLVALQQRDVYVSSDLTGVAWQPVLTSRGAARAFVVHSEGLAVMDDLRFVALLDEDLEEVWATIEPLGSTFRFDGGQGGLSTDGETVLAFNGRTQVAAIRDGEIELRRLLHAPGEGRWTLWSMDRAVGGTLWGFSLQDLVRSDDGGRTWRRVAVLPEHLKRLAVLPTGEPLVFRDGGAFLWRDGGFEPVPDLDSVVVRGLERRNGTWLLYGGRCPTWDEFWMSFELHSGEEPPCSSVVMISSDGSSWQVLDEREDNFAQALHWSEDDGLIALYRDGTVAVGKLTRDGAPRLDSIASTKVSLADGSFSFDSEFKGELFGWDATYRTSDGGMTWTSVEESAMESDNGRWRLDGGVTVRLQGTNPETAWLTGAVTGTSGAELHVRRESGWETVREFAKPLVHCRLASSGGLLVETAAGAILLLEPDGETWTTLRSETDVPSD